MSWGDGLLEDPERCFEELERARAAYRPLQGSQWELFSGSVAAGCEEQLRVVGEARELCAAALPGVRLLLRLSFRGTVSQENMVTNLQAELVPLSLGTGSGLVHRGFQDRRAP